MFLTKEKLLRLIRRTGSLVALVRKKSLAQCTLVTGQCCCSHGLDRAVDLIQHIAGRLVFNIVGVEVSAAGFFPPHPPNGLVCMDGLDVVSSSNAPARRNCCKTHKLGHTDLDFKKEMFVHIFSPNPFWVFLTGYVLGTEGLVTFVQLACFHLSNPSVSWTPGFVGAAKSGTRA